MPSGAALAWPGRSAAVSASAFALARFSASAFASAARRSRFPPLASISRVDVGHGRCAALDLCFQPNSAFSAHCSRVALGPGPAVADRIGTARLAAQATTRQASSAPARRTQPTSCSRREARNQADGASTSAGNSGPSGPPVRSGPVPGSEARDDDDRSSLVVVVSSVFSLLRRGVQEGGRLRVPASDPRPPCAADARADLPPAVLPLDDDHRRELHPLEVAIRRLRPARKAPGGPSIPL